jgi:uncharacterized repeat protein (TIGR01451 family)
MRIENAPRHLTTRPHSFVLIGVFLFVAAAVALPLYTVSSSALRNGSSKLNVPSERSAGAGQLNSRVSLSSIRPSGSSAFSSLLPIPAYAPETIQTFASDCTTPKTTFVLGEVVCAETALVTETDRFVNWFGPGGHAFGGAGQTDITTNQPQDFLYTPTLTGDWSVAIADSSNSSIVSTNFTVVAPGPIVTYKVGCAISSDAFVLGETVCARVTGGTGRRLTFVDPTGFIRQTTSITSDPQDISFQLPVTNTSTINDQTVDNRGTWKANMITSRGSVVARTEFVVTNPAAKSANLSISKLTRAGDESIPAGSSGAFDIFVTNFGPDAAANVVISDTLPAHTTFVSLTQTDGPTFVCSGTATVTCTLASLARGGSASFTLAYTVDSGTAAGTQICNTASVSSDISDPDTSDNSSQSCITVPFSGSGGACTVTCPSNITTSANTTDSDGNSGAVVTYPAPTSSGPCGSITTDHCNNCFFPVGTTVVTSTADTGDSCSFTVTVNNPNVPTISCPANQTANADNNCQAHVNVGTATTTGGLNVTVTATRSDGQPMYTCDGFGNCTRNSSDAPFSAGTTTITWTAYSHDIPGPYGPQTCKIPGNPGQNCDEESHRTGSASCTQTITVNDVTPPNIGATDQTISADSNCQAMVPDYSSTVTDNCGCSSSDNSESCAGHSRITVTQDPAAGTVVGPGQYPVHITANDGSSNNDGAGNTSQKTITLTVADTTPPTIHCPANITTNTEPGTCAAHVTPGTATATDNCDSNPTITASRSDGRPLTDTYPGGTTTITWTATDHAGNHSSCTQTITVVDNQPPVIVLNGQTPSMWPPNHDMHTFQVTDFVASVSDNCGVSIGDVVITKVTSDELDDATGGGDGNTINDIQIAANCKSVQLRSERAGSGDGRVYTIYFRLADASGNVTTATAKVVVPHDQGNGPETVVDSGPHYTVLSNCP